MDKFWPLLNQIILCSTPLLLVFIALVVFYIAGRVRVLHYAFQMQYATNLEKDNEAEDSND